MKRRIRQNEEIAAVRAVCRKENISVHKGGTGTENDLVAVLQRALMDFYRMDKSTVERVEVFNYPGRGAVTLLIGNLGVVLRYLMGRGCIHANVGIATDASDRFCEDCRERGVRVCALDRADEEGEIHRYVRSL
jgi:hypothetical protein